MPAARKLASVSNSRTPAKRTPGRPKKLLAEAVRDGERSILATLRSKLAKQIDECTRSSAMAPLIKQFRDIDAQIRAMDAREVERRTAETEDDDLEDDAGFDPDQL